MGMSKIGLIEAMQALEEAFDKLESVGFPAERLGMMKYELFKSWAGNQSAYFGSIRHCYLAFYGDGGEAKYVKVGISRDPKRRVKDFVTGNPLRVQWAFAAEIEGAREVELALHDHLRNYNTQGEWFALGGLTEPQVCAFVARMAEVASGVAGSQVVFHRI